MKQSLRKIFGAVSAVFLIGLFVTAAPVRAASTDERIKELEATLNQLKAEQQQVKQEQVLIREDALAARSKLPSFRYRPGSGLRIRGADRSWEYRVRGEMSGFMGFFPGGGRSPENSEDKGPTNGGMYLRHQQFGHFVRLLNGLYEFGFNMKFDRDGGDRARASSQRMQIRFQTWSPYYPELQLVNMRMGNFSRNTRVSSTAGLAIEREPAFTDFLSTGSSKGFALVWHDVPVGPSEVNFQANYYSGSDQFNARVAEDPLPQKGVGIGLGVVPFKKSKNKWLKGLDLRFNYVNVADDDNRADENDNNQMRVRVRSRVNRATIYSQSTRGRHSYGEPSLDYTVGPFNIAYTWGRHTGEQRRTGDAGSSNFSAARMTVNNIAMGMYLWGPKGFMSGSRNGGWRLSYTHNRIYIDAGSGFAAGETANEFSDMRRWHYIENIILLRWYQKRNITWAIEFQTNLISKMKGSGSKPSETRRRLNILEDGGTYNQVVFHTKWIF